MPEQKRKHTPCYCIPLRRASGHITDFYDRILQPSGITIPQYSILSHLANLEVASTSALAQDMNLDRSTLVRNMKLLIDRGLVTDLAASGTRDHKFTLSKDGLDTLDAAEKLWVDAQEKIEDFLGAENAETLLTLLSKLNTI